MKLQTIKVEEAVGKVLSHDITQIVKGEAKGALFKKGHIIRPEDVPELLRLGKENIYILDLDHGDVHEDEAGVRLGEAVTGEWVTWSGPKESRVNMHAACDGLLKINIPALEAINELPDVILSTLPNNTVVKEGELLAGTKVIPLVVPETTVTAAEDICRQAGGWVIKVLPFKELKVGAVITGSEVYKKRIRDGFGPVITEKVEAFGSEILGIDFAPDNAEIIAAKINKMASEGADIIFVTGGMSVDPDDVTPNAIRLAGARVEKYGAAALPGAMFMLAYLGDVPIMGVPACGMFFKITVVDLILPRLLAGERVTRRDIVALACGGLCRACPECRYPNCTFGKGSH
ncbi:bifunctional molybdenum cofactor biosynthesis protein MoaC/MogA [Pelotomaculum schinkii]|uniref:Molybdopterin molybdenumtransferase n=1 Tax=Pelotomaculum schinkii TaxID=78350 RepID=A0A4Y7R6U3_9FIRM|nr:molybdopterin-binding protein [Pelotomaculum schinkii]TEB04567.1 bifunctional molybdenum cofactor biosynthesis protein MoaC/MogA [Pelotomaculum schinkii]